MLHTAKNSRIRNETYCYFNESCGPTLVQTLVQIP